MQNTSAVAQPERLSTKSARLHYLDWLRVLAILGVFLFHAVHPFDVTDWHIKNTEQSLLVTLVFAVFLYPWGMPLFFLMAGAGSQFALRRRTGRQYASERVRRLFIPFVIGTILFSPIQYYFEWTHKTASGLFEGSYLEFIGQYGLSFSPKLFGRGYHLWFLGFLFAYSLIALPLFLWLKQGVGRRFVGWLAKLSETRGGLLVFVIPLVVVQLVLRPLYLDEHDWADFAYTLVFFVSGYILYSDQRFVRAIRRDWLLMLILGVIGTLSLMAGMAADVVMTWATTPGSPEFALLWSVFTLNSWCWAMFILYVGMRFLDCRNQWLEYGQEAILPFFVFHQPVIIVIAFYVVQWNVSLLVKLLLVVFSSFLVSVGLYELLVRRIEPLRVLFGVKARRREKPQVEAGL